jgi:RNase P/RNase MRP subunit POP5
MSKVSSDRPRYIAFQIHGGRPVSRRAVGDALGAAARQAGWPGPPQLTRYEWPYGIVRVSHEFDARARQLVAGLPLGLDARCETLATSGTIRALTRRVGVLEERGETAGAGTGKKESKRPA